MNWESTDNFGNLSVATSDAVSLEDLEFDIVSLITVVFARSEGEVIFAVDADYSEISAPSGDHVTHVLTLNHFPKFGTEAIQVKLREILTRMGHSAEVRGPW